jgi:hypothetical protein
MTTGALIFAFNNEETDYVNMAAWSANRIREHLGIPVAVVTALDPSDPRLSGFDRVIVAESATGGTRYFADYERTISWHNAGRPDAYKLTPWDQTLVLDADYVVCSDMLKMAVESDKDFLCFKNAFDVTGLNDFDGLNSFGDHRFPMWWATVMMFRKSPTAQYIFDTMNMIKQNWDHYRNIYHIGPSLYRNDYALSIALGLVSGHTLKVDSIPWEMPSVLPEHELTFDGKQWIVKFTNSENQRRSMSFAGLDFHAMGKKHLENVIAAA